MGNPRQQVSTQEQHKRKENKIVLDGPQRWREEPRPFCFGNKSKYVSSSNFRPQY